MAALTWLPRHDCEHVTSPESSPWPRAWLARAWPPTATVGYRAGMSQTGQGARIAECALPVERDGGCGLVVQNQLLWTASSRMSVVQRPVV